ncbi:MAG: YfhO family protein [Cytophagaceae bacterium]
MSLFLKKLLPHLGLHLLFIAVLFAFYSPILDGKKLNQNDVIQSGSALHEANVYQEKTGEEILWSNSSFSGMPVWRGYGANLISKVHRGFLAVMPATVYMGYLAFLGFYILAIVLGANFIIAFATSAAFALSSFTLISIEAGHLNKVLAMATMPPVLAGVILLFNKKYWLGISVLLFFLALHIFYAHYQITYYLLFVLAAYGIHEFVKSIRENDVKGFLFSVLISLGVSIIAILPNVSSIWTNYEYSKSTTRGGSELTQYEKDGDGLDKEYAMSWSNGIDEIGTFIIPYFYGGASAENIGKSSAMYQALRNTQLDDKTKNSIVKNAPLYWGGQPFTSGPVYLGALIVFLFVFGMFLVKDSSKWWILAVSIIAVMMSWGKNIEWFSDLLFYHFPLYNKFRSVTMAVTIVQLTFPILAVMSLVKIWNEEVSKEEIMKALKWSLIGIGGLLLFLLMFCTSLFDFTSENDAKYQYPEWLIEALVEDRISLFRKDTIRSLIFVILGAALIWAWVKKWVKPIFIVSALSALFVIDLYVVDKRYLNEDDFIRARKSLLEKVVAPTSADKQILTDTTLSYRVMNVTKSTFNDATTSYHHKSIGGYSAIKLRRYQDLIERQIGKNNMSVLSMLNAKYFIVPNEQDPSNPYVQKNPGALGNAWFVQKIDFVKNADEEITALDSLRPETEAVADVKFQNDIKNKSYEVDSSSYIKMIAYHPNHLKYVAESNTTQLAVFSEIYYQPGWNAYVDGKLVNHIRVDYVLRALELQPGKHTIEFKFEPKHYFTGEKISLAGSVILILLVLFSVYMLIKQS